MLMKRECLLALLSLALCTSVQGGLIPGSLNFGDTRTGHFSISAFPSDSVVQSYTLGLNFSSDAFDTIHGTLVLVNSGGTFTQSIDDFLGTFNGKGSGDISLPFSSPDYGYPIGSKANGNWTLNLWNSGSSGFGNVNFIDGWSLSIKDQNGLIITAVPEPVNVALGIFAGVFVVGGLCRTQRVRNRIHRCWASVNHWLDAV